MKLGISLDAYLKTTTPEDGIRRLAAIGFDAIDLNLSDYCAPDSPLASDDWRPWIEGIGRAAAEAGIELCQVHAPIYWEFGGRDPHLDTLTGRTLEASEMLGIPWAVFHPRTLPEGASDENAEQTAESNAAWLGRWADIASGRGVSIAIENLFPFRSRSTPTYGTRPSELTDLIDRLDRGNVGACLDTGHAFHAGIDPAAFALELGGRLRVLHVHDNLGTDDQHVAPFAGKIDWPGFMDSLREIAYGGVFSLEVHSQVQNMPEELIDGAVRFVHGIGRHLLKHIR